MPDRVQLFTDGACRGNPGPGGWGAVLRFGSREKELFGGDPATTNNRMELTAVIRGLEALTRPCAVDVTTDSVYVKNGITQWIHNWKRNGWRTAAKSRSRMTTCGVCWMRQRHVTMSAGTGSRDTRGIPKTSERTRWRTSASTGCNTLRIEPGYIARAIRSANH